jgi:hypothetical protein
MMYFTAMMAVILSMGVTAMIFLMAAPVPTRWTAVMELTPPAINARMSGSVLCLIPP